MSWLLVAKILPPFFHGDPPNSGMLQKNRPVAWRVEFDGKPIGYAVSQAIPGALGTTEIHSRIEVADIPLQIVVPPLFASVVRNLGEIDLNMQTRTTIDTLGNLASFDTKLRINNLPTSIRMFGTVVDDQLQIRLRTGDHTQQFQYPWSKDAWLGRELTPEAKLLQIYVGRKWQREVYSPFSQSAMEIIEAQVVEETSMMFQDELIKARRVEYRTLSGVGIDTDNRLRANLWVAEDGTVLRQDMYFMGVKLRFDRLTDEQSEKIGAEQLDLAAEATVITE